MFVGRQNGADVAGNDFLTQPKGTTMPRTKMAIADELGPGGTLQRVYHGKTRTLPVRLAWIIFAAIVLLMAAMLWQKTIPGVRSVAEGTAVRAAVAGIAATSASRRPGMAAPIVPGTRVTVGVARSNCNSEETAKLLNPIYRNATNAEVSDSDNAEPCPAVLRTWRLPTSSPAVSGQFGAI
jgi:hypothetical protein